MRITTQSLLLLLYVSCLSWLCTAESQPEDSFRWLKEDPDVSRNFTQIIQGYGYPVEEHQVTTTDGYVLTVFRIPQGRQETAPSNTKRPAVYLQHGLIDSSFTWIVNLPGQSLPYILADAGYDVWMGNNRGNRYSMKHIKYSVKSKEFWDFSFDEFAQYDVQNITNYILQQTGSQKLTYVGHSQGTTQMFAALSINPEFAQKLNLYIGLGPVGSIDYMQNTLLRLMGLLDVDKVIELFGIREFLITPKQIAKLFPAVCTLDPYLCDDVIEFLCGKHKGAFNNTRMPVVGAHEPGGTSVKDMSHWAQMLRERKFQKYDYGTKGNLQRYGTPEPPAYNIKCALSNLTLPIGLVWGGKDELADPYDVKDLLSIIPNPVMSVYVDNYAHLDFCWALDAHERIYPQILQTIAKYAN